MNLEFRELLRVYNLIIKN